MRILNFYKSGIETLAVNTGDRIIDLSIADPAIPRSLIALLEQGQSGMKAVERAVQTAPASAEVALDSIRYAPPISNPPKIICVGANYKDHAAESNYKLPEQPVFFARYAKSLVAHGEPLIKPLLSDQFDYEVELAVIIGREGRHIPVANALDFVAGYSVFNDGSVRDYQFKSDQWLWGKTFDGSGGFGPEFVTADEVPPGAEGLQLKTVLNGVVVQSASTSDMVFSVATLIAALSEAMTLEVGDVIATGTPAGVGIFRNPPLWLKDGDVCEVAIDRVGSLINPVRNEAKQP